MYAGLTLLLLWTIGMYLQGKTFLQSYPLPSNLAVDCKIENTTAVENENEIEGDNGCECDCECKDSEYLVHNSEFYVQTAKKFNPVTDKVTTHGYDLMYGKFLLPYYHQNPTMKMLEIGLGCDMSYGPGASVALHQDLFPKAELWEAEFDAKCVNKHRHGKLNDINVLTGDQMNDTVLDQWIEESGGNFDVVIDDGGHANCQIWHSFKKLWPTLKSGGLYFIEDMHVGRRPMYRKYQTETCDNNFIISEEIQDLVDVLMYRKHKRLFHSQVEYFFCQRDGCLIAKK